MGYVYQGRKLCCDMCGKAGARKMHCPFNWCSSTAVCADCRKSRKHDLSRDYHRERGCERSAERQVERYRATQALLDAGAFLRCSAMNTDGNRVHVIFRNGTGQEQGWYMPSEAYAAIALGADATPDDYRAHGALTEAPTHFY